MCRLAVFFLVYSLTTGHGRAAFLNQWPSPRSNRHRCRLSPLRLAAVDSSEEPTPVASPPHEKRQIIEDDLQVHTHKVDSIQGPAPGLDALQITLHCMEALRSLPPDQSLQRCFDFSTDQCRAAVGGSIEVFLQYASNPVFGGLVQCPSYEIVSVGPVLPGGPHRGAMQTVLVQIESARKTTNPAVTKSTISKPSTRLSARKKEAASEEAAVQTGEALRYLWTFQKQRRPPRQDCWLIHEVLSVKNAYAVTT